MKYQPSAAELLLGLLVAWLLPWGCGDIEQATISGRRVRFQTRVFIPPLIGSEPVQPIPDTACEVQGTFVWTAIPGDDLLSQGTTHNTTSVDAFQAQTDDELEEQVITLPGGCRFEALADLSDGLQPGDWRLRATQFNADGIIWLAQCDVTIGEDLEPGGGIKEVWAGFTAGAEGCAFQDRQDTPAGGAIFFPDCPPEVCNAPP